MATVSEKMSAIADAIREKSGATDKLSLDAMETEIPKVYEQGKQAQYDEFWDTYQNNGKRKFYQYAFAGRGAWKPKIFKPKYNMKPTNAMNMFAFFQETGAKVDLREIGVNIDFSDCVQMGATFDYALDIAATGVINAINAPVLTSTFNHAENLHTTEVLLNPNGSQTFASSFAYCNSLENIMIGAPRKGETCSELITMPFDEAFEEPQGIFVGFKQSLVDTYSEYFNIDNTLVSDALYTCICFETGETRANAYYYPAEGWRFEVPSWWIPEDRTQPVSFYLCKNEEDAFTRESIGNNIDFKSCPLSRKSIGCVIAALLSSATGKTLTLKKSAVEAAFVYTNDWEMLVHSKSNEMNGNWTIALV